MYKKWSAAGATLFVVGLLLVAPAGATDTWDLTSGPISLSYTVDLSGAANIDYDWDWSNGVTVGMFSGGAGAQMYQGLMDWTNASTQFPTYPGLVTNGTLNTADKFNMQRFPTPGSYDEAMYDVDCTNPLAPTSHATPVAPGNNRGVWFDRDGVDQWQALDSLNVSGDTYNTLGVYDVALTFTKISATTVAVCPTVNGIPTTFYTTFSPVTVDFAPAGISFEATPEQMRSMQVVLNDAPNVGAINISDPVVDGVATYTTAADCTASESFVPSTGGTVSLLVDANHKYQVDARGTYYAGGTSQFDIRADAQYSQDTIQRDADPAADWTDLVNGYEGYGDILLDLMVDGQNVQWGPYTSTHEYSLTKVAGTGVLSFAFDINDIYAANNTGGLCVSVTDLGPLFHTTGTWEQYPVGAPVYQAQVQQPINTANTSNWSSKSKGGIPVMFELLEKPGPAVFESIGDDAAAENDYAYMSFTPDALTFADIGLLQTDYQFTTGDCHGGSLRWQVRTSLTQALFIYYGDEPNTTDCTTNSQSGGNMIGLSDLRYDTSQYPGGTFYDTYAHALTLMGSLPIVRVSLVIDSGWGGNQVLTVSNTTVNDNVYQWDTAGTGDFSPTCDLPDALIDVTKIDPATSGAINEATVYPPADTDTNNQFRVVDCKYQYVLSIPSLLGIGTYDVEILVDGNEVATSPNPDVRFDLR